jgi:hypothetical protein
MGCILLGGAGVLLFGWWFMAVYGDPGKVTMLFVLGSIGAAFWAGHKFSEHNDDDK